MSNNRFKTAFLGLSDSGKSLVEAASHIDRFDIAAVADKDTAVVESVAACYKCEAYDDYRQLIMQNQLDCLVVAEGMHCCEEYVRMAMRKGCNVLKVAPMARDFEEATEMVKLADEEGVKYYVTNELRFSESFCAFREYLGSGQIEQVYLVNGICISGIEPEPAWHSDWKLSGGGVILHNCYDMIDQIVSNFSRPERVYCLFTNQAGDRQQRLYLTEDTAVINMRFGENMIGNLIVSKAFGPQRELLNVYGKNKVLSVSSEHFEISDNHGLSLERFDYSDDRGCRLKKMLASFVCAVETPDNNSDWVSSDANLENMAVIESSYLSARTAMPEDPSRILQMSGRFSG